MTPALGKEVIKSKERGDEPTTVRGILIPVDWDERGNVLAAAISGLDEQEYLVEQDAKGKELLGLMRREIEVSGTVRKEIKGRNRIRVKSYGLKTGIDW